MFALGWKPEKSIFRESLRAFRIGIDPLGEMVDLKNEDDLLTARDIEKEFGWPIGRGKALIRIMARDGEIQTIRGFRGKFVRRADLQARLDRT